MEHVVDFYQAGEGGNSDSLLGSVIIKEDGTYRVTGNRQLRQLVNNDLYSGIPSFTSSQKLLPKDGKEFVDRLLQRYSGSRVWARLNEE